MTQAKTATPKRYRAKITRPGATFYYQRTIQGAAGTPIDQWTTDPNAAAIFSTKAEADAEAPAGATIEEAPEPESVELPF